MTPASPVRAAAAAAAGEVDVGQALVELARRVVDPVPPTSVPPAVLRPPAVRMADAARRVIDETPRGELDVETVEALELLGDSVEAALRAARRGED